MSRAAYCAQLAALVVVFLGVVFVLALVLGGFVELFALH